VFGLLVTAIFLLTILQTGVERAACATMARLSRSDRGERFLVLPAVALMFVLGLWPQLVLGFINPTVLNLVETLQPVTAKARDCTAPTPERLGRSRVPIDAPGRSTHRKALARIARRPAKREQARASAPGATRR
jgi:hypothetical protein